MIVFLLAFGEYSVGVKWWQLSCSVFLQGKKKAVIMKIIQSEMRVKKTEMPLRYLSYPRESITILTSLTSGICACMDSVW